MNTVSSFLSKALDILRKRPFLVGASIATSLAVVALYLRLRLRTKRLILSSPLLRPLISMSNPSIPSTKVVNTYSAISYNILADSMTSHCVKDNHAGDPNLMSKIKDPIFSWEYRKHLIVEELAAYNADLLGLQEVQANHQIFLVRKLNAKFPKKKYECLFKSRNDNLRRIDGVAILFDKRRFNLVLYDEVSLGDFSKEMSLKEYAAKNATHLTTLNLHYAQIALLEDKKTKDLVCFVNAYIYWNPLYPDVKLVQSYLVLRGVQRFIESYYIEAYKAKPKEKLKEITVIMCGDFNSLPDSAVYQLYSQGHVDTSDATAQKIPVVNFKHSFTKIDPQTNSVVPGLNSAYSSRGEPNTNITRKFKGTLDYIWYTTVHPATFNQHISSFFKPERLPKTQRLLQLKQVLKEINVEEDLKKENLPNAKLPSDHVAIMAVLELLEPTNDEAMMQRVQSLEQEYAFIQERLSELNSKMKQLQNK